MNMIEKVARVIEAALFDNGVIITYSNVLAKAAIEAMKEPTDEMTDAGNSCYYNDCSAETIYFAMIEAALELPEPEKN